MNNELNRNAHGHLSLASIREEDVYIGMFENKEELNETE